jgi:hypothetical protein
VIGDSLNLIVTAMNNAHFFLALVKATSANKDVTPDAQKDAQAAQQAFIPAQIDEKFNRFEKDYGIMCELEDSITSIGFVMQILMQQGGIVKAAQVDGEGELVIELKAVESQNAEVVDGEAQGKLVDLRKVFREGDAVFFSDVELQLVLVSVASFADSLFKSVAKYARSIQDSA